jgi:hypothetical protein
VRRSTYQDVLRLVDARPLFDTSGVQAYSINGHQVLFLRPRPQPGSQAATPSGSSGDVGGAGTGRPARSGIKRGAVLRLPQRPGEEPQIVARCAIDGRQLMSADARYCSIRCALLSDRKRLSFWVALFCCRSLHCSPSRRCVQLAKRQRSR